MGTRLNGLVVAVTGGARGIGLACGRAFAEAGALVALGDLDATLAARGADSHGVGLGLDVRDLQSCQSFVDTVTAQLGPIDVLINSAGVAIPGHFLTLTAAEQDLQVDVNFGGTLRCLRLVLPAMVSRGSGHVVNVASAAGRMAAPGAAVYSATKHAVVGLTEAVRWETRGTGVHMTAVLPTVVATEMAAGLRTHGLPTVSAERVAAVVVGAVRRRRPPAVVLVPRWFTPVQRADGLAPQWIRDVARRIVRLGVPDGDQDRRRYLERVSRQLTGESDGPSPSALAEHDRQ